MLWHFRVLIAPDDVGRAKMLLGIDEPRKNARSSGENDEEVFVECAWGAVGCRDAMARNVAPMGLGAFGSYGAGLWVVV